MFNRARLHLTLLYAALLSVTVVLVAGAIGTLAVQDARRTDDRELQIRAEAKEADLPIGPRFSPSGPPLPGPGGPPPPLEGQGLLEYVIPVFNGQLLSPPDGDLPGLPDVEAAQAAVRTGKGQYRTITVDGSQVRLYALPDLRTGHVEGVIEIARSRYFVNGDITDIVLIALVAGAIGLVLSGTAGYWLAGRTLRPIAVALARQRNFAADASHELRTPLTVILTNAELLTLHPERRLAEYQDVVTDIVEEIQRLGRLVSDLLTLARADEGTAMLAAHVIDVSEVAQTVGRQLAPVAGAKGLELRLSVEPDVMVIGDRDRLQELAVILVDNAVRYTSAGRVEIRVQRKGHEALLSVSDTGPGIAAEHLPHIFERFYRTDAARSTESGGAGLGLALAKWIAESHHGEIEAVSAPGSGSTFTVHLPAARARDGSGPGELLATGSDRGA